MDIFWSLLTFILQNLKAIIPSIIVGIITGVSVKLAVSWYLGNRGKPKIDIQCYPKGNKLGFAVIIKKGHILKDARVRCNRIEYPWTEKDGSTVKRKNLLVGDEPAISFPFQGSYTISCKKQNGKAIREVSIKLTDVITQKEVYDHSVSFVVPKEPDAKFKFPSTIFPLTIRIIAEGIEEVKDYKMIAGISGTEITEDFDKPEQPFTISCNWSLRKRHWFLPF